MLKILFSVYQMEIDYNEKELSTVAFLRKRIFFNIVLLYFALEIFIFLLSCLCNWINVILNILYAIYLYAEDFLLNNIRWYQAAVIVPPTKILLPTETCLCIKKKFFSIPYIKNIHLLFKTFILQILKFYCKLKELFSYTILDNSNWRLCFIFLSPLFIETYFYTQKLFKIGIFLTYGICLAMNHIEMQYWIPFVRL